MNLTTRKNQLWFLIVLSAMTMVIPYYIQGALSSGKLPTGLGENVWRWDHLAWALRAIVEGLVIGYIARTKANNIIEAIALWVFKFALIALIAFTLGPVMYAALNGLQMSQALPPVMQWAWAFGLASYMPLMVLGASFAYKVQPNDEGMQIIDTELQGQFETMQTELAEAQAKLAELQTSNETMQTRIATLQAQAKAVAAWGKLSATGKAAMIAQHCNGDLPTASELAEELRVNVSTVTRGYKSVNEN